MNYNKKIADEVWNKFNKIKTQAIKSWFRNDLDLTYNLIYPNTCKPPNWNPSFLDLEKSIMIEFRHKSRQALENDLAIQEKNEIIKELTVKIKKGVKVL